MAKFINEKVKAGLVTLVKELVWILRRPPSTPIYCQKRQIRKKYRIYTGSFHHRSSWSDSSEKWSCSQKGSLVGSKFITEGKIYWEGSVPEQKILHATGSHFKRVGNYNNYLLLNRSQTNSGNMTTQTGKYTKGMVTLMKRHIFDYEVPHVRVLGPIETIVWL